MRLLLAFWLFLTSLATAGQRIYPVASMPVSKLVVFDVQRVNDYAERCLVASAQGIYNSRPLAKDLVYLVWSQEDAFWLDWLKKNRGIQTRQLANMAQLIALGSRDCVVYDEHPGHLPNIATMISGVNRWLMAGDPELVHRFHLKVRADLSGRFQTNAAAYDWVWTKYGHSFSRQCASFTVPYRTPTHNPAQLRDYLVANKVFTFWTSGSLDSMISGGNREAEERKVGTILREGFPLCTPVLGYPWSGDGYGPGEGDGLTFLSWLGKFLVPTDNFSNLSVWSTFPVSLKKLQTSAPEEVVFDANKTYASLVMSDGDNLCTFENYWPNYWRELGKVDFPVGWTMGPTLRELAPPIYE